MNFTEDNKDWLELLQFQSSMYKPVVGLPTEEDKVVKFRPVEAPDTGDKARKFKKLFA